MKCLALIHFIACVGAIGLDVAEPGHERLVFLSNAILRRILDEPFAKGSVERLALLPGDRASSLNQMLVGSEGDVFTILVDTVFVQRLYSML